MTASLQVLGLLYTSSRAISYLPLWDISFQLDLEAQEKEPSFSSSAETGSASLEKQSDDENAPPVVTDKRFQ